MKFPVSFIFILLSSSGLFGLTEFTIGSYNSGGLPDHYDYLRAAATAPLIAERYDEEKGKMMLNEKAQMLALQMLFAEESSKTKKLAQKKWEKIKKRFYRLVGDKENVSWRKKAENMITPHRERPIVIHDERITSTLTQFLNGSSLKEKRLAMARELFKKKLRFDILCLQEANDLEELSFPEDYAILFAKNSKLKNAVAWNTKRFRLIDSSEPADVRSLIIRLQDLLTGEVVAIASAHLKGSHPYHRVIVAGGWDSKQGDEELKSILNMLESSPAAIKLIGMDANVTAMHPRLQLLSEKGYRVDFNNALYPTCTNPELLLNTRIDWIAIQSKMQVNIVNLPIQDVHLNDITTNISDHKPIAARVSY